ncbi:MAG: phage/plasmid primase, P4 family [Aureliella sp.]
MTGFEVVKEAAAGRWPEIIPALTGLSPDVLHKVGDDHPCPKCGGESVVWPAEGAERSGSIACRNCTNDKPTGDGIATVAAFAGLATQGEACSQIADYLGLDTRERRPSTPVDIIEAVCRAKSMPREAFQKFEPQIANRNGGRVARVPVFNELGERHSYFDLSPQNKGLFKGGKGSSGMFFPGRLPKAGETWLLVEGVKDAAALLGLGYLAAGLPSSSMPAKFARLFNGVDIVVVHDLDDAGHDGAKQTSQRLRGIASSITIARLPGELKPKSGDDVRDVINRHGGDAVRQAVDDATEWKGGPPAGTETNPQWLLEESNRTDVGNSRRFIDENGEFLRYVPEWKTWLVWDGRRWSRDGNVGVVRLAKKYSEKLWQELGTVISHARLDRDEFGVLQTFVKRTNQAGPMHAFLSLAECDERVVTNPDELNKLPAVLNVLNGTIELDSGTLREHRQGDNLTQIANVDFDSDATCPDWEQTMRYVFAGDDELIRYFQQILGYGLYGKSVEAILPIWFGNGNNGKSTVWNVLMAILGEYALAAKQELILPTQHAQPHEIAELYSRRFVMVAEPEENRALSESTVKAIVGGDRISACRKYEHPFTFDPTHLVCVASNHKPRVRGTDDGIWRRIKLIPFTVDLRKVVTPDKHFSSHLIEDEGPGILNWLLAGYRDWKENGLIEPQAVKDATAEYREAEDVIGQFVSDCCELDENASEYAAVIYRRFTAAGFQLGSKTFFQKLQAKFESCKSKRGRLFRGLRLIPDASEDGPEA